MGLASVPGIRSCCSMHPQEETERLRSKRPLGESETGGHLGLYVGRRERLCVKH
ncbi:hypothetical protein GW17_00015936 [Ensete ventricosum]|uniref:Uncharacterized protein n=1 Tax=Ensete ventricosum TaxID=4639 RepID=A0A427B1R3_ENSVE|nr:hypothetical protein B296_00000981 [Ensete ventricosum]RWW19976.1 hypothetical protein GW17_00015936 [Ensete ventricosum]RZR77538.1 hypothetical protein BHM03_00002650 [Ensete ventricosum]